MSIVSIIIPTFNRKFMVCKAIDSALNQTYKDIEIIVVDDGSSDNTQELLVQKYRDKIKYFYQENRGVAGARNAGIQESRGEYIAFLDSDDTWMPAKLDAQMKIFQSDTDVGLVYCGYTTLDMQGEIVGQVKPACKGMIYYDLVLGNQMGASSVVIKRECVEQIGFFQGRYSPAEDYEYWLRISRKYKVDFVEDPLVQYVTHDQGLSQNGRAMEQAVMRILEDHWQGNQLNGNLMHRSYSNNCVNLAWNYYRNGDHDSFKQLLHLALTHCPTQKLFIHGADAQQKERAVFAVFSQFWTSGEQCHNRQDKNKAYTAQYLQLAWEYYHQGNMKQFRRCVSSACRFAFPTVPVRLIVPYIKSFLGKNLSEKIHAVRKRLLPHIFIIH
jgi:glycosyltransferase involved in cell wall biosynthesis